MWKALRLALLTVLTSRVIVGLCVLQQECMYLHDYGDEAASFSKEEIQQGFVPSSF